MAEKLNWTAAQAAAATKGKLIYGPADGIFSGVSIDSRTTACGDLFIAIVGPNHDGHNHAVKGVARGQKGVVINHAANIALPHDQWRQKGHICIEVEDTTRALGDMAAFNRKRAGFPVVAITGSNGKTSTRRMTLAVMQQKFCVLSTQGNLNNEIGLPLTLLNTDCDHNLAVLELGMNHFGEIRRLAQICRPDIGVITNVGPAHLEGLGSVAGVARAKGELLEYIKPGGKVILNGDDDHLKALAEKSSHDVIFFGFANNADVGAESITYGPTQTVFTLRLPHGRIEATLNVPGRFMVLNALAAAAGGFLMGLSPEQISAGLSAFTARKGRLDITTTDAGVNLIDDTYNANPASMTAALELLAQLKGKDRGIFVCGDMFELGEESERLHQNIGAKAAESGVNRLYAAGRFAPMVAKGARLQGMPTERIFTGTKEEIISALTIQLRPADWVLVKGSRGMAMETVSEAIKSIKKFTKV